jgi:trans-aconitate 2-methyltransferase
MTVIWDPAQYGRFAAERGRPFLDLIARIDAGSPRRVVDAGCGPGNLTELLADRWPDARVEGFDSSAEMIEAARARNGKSDYRIQDVVSWQLPDDVDVVVSNAVLQWVPTHRDLLRRWSAELPEGGWLAVQMPGNFGSPSHQLLRELVARPAWARVLGPDILRHDDVGTPESYAGLLLDAGLRADVWETTYLHVLQGRDAVLEWMRGTGLRPVLGALPPGDVEAFTAEYAAELRRAFPTGAHGTLLPFRRIFAVARKPV